jgi:hypothetical protein
LKKRTYFIGGFQFEFCLSGVRQKRRHTQLSGVAHGFRQTSHFFLRKGNSSVLLVPPPWPQPRLGSIWKDKKMRCLRSAPTVSLSPADMQAILGDLNPHAQTISKYAPWLSWATVNQDDVNEILVHHSTAKCQA